MDYNIYISGTTTNGTPYRMLSVRPLLEFKLLDIQVKKAMRAAMPELKKIFMDNFLYGQSIYHVDSVGTLRRIFPLSEEAQQILSK